MGGVGEVGKVESTDELDMVLAKGAIPREPQRYMQIAMTPVMRYVACHHDVLGGQRRDRC